MLEGTITFKTCKFVNKMMHTTPTKASVFRF
jgi:hypothetical protein